jgi:hypothetical protein
LGTQKHFVDPSFEAAAGAVSRAIKAKLKKSEVKNNTFETTRKTYLLS